MKTKRIVYASMAGILISIGGPDTYSQDLSKKLVDDLKNEIVQSLPEGFIQNMRMQLMVEIKQEIKTRMKADILDGARPVSQAVLKEMAPATNGNLKPFARHLMHESSNEASDLNGLRVEAFRDSSSPDASGAAIVTHGSNPVKVLTVNQVRKLYTGEYSNWREVGGPDLPVKLIVYSNNVSSLDRLMGFSINKDALRLSFLSLMIPSINGTRGSIGFLSPNNMEQLRLVTRLGSLQRIAVETDNKFTSIFPSFEMPRDSNPHFKEDRTFSNFAIVKSRKLP
jgi:hypothetical protein